MAVLMTRRSMKIFEVITSKPRKSPSMPLAHALEELSDVIHALASCDVDIGRLLTQN